MARAEQLPTPVDIKVVAGDPFTLTFTATSGVTTFASPAVAMTTSGGDAFTTDPGVPSVSANAAVITLSWSAADTAALNATTRGKTYKYSVEATLDGAGPVQLFGGTISVYPVGTTGTSSSAATSATINTGGVAVSATITLGAPGPTGATGPAGDWATPLLLKTVSASTYSLLAADAGYTIRFTNVSGCTLTVPTDATLDLVDGFWCTLFAEGGAVTLSVSGLAFAGVAPPSSIAFGDSAMVVKTSTANTWIFFGAGPAQETIVVPIGDETTALETGTAKVTFRMPFALTVSAVRASLTSASTSGAPTFDINEGGSSILGTKLSIDANEKTSTTAASAATITDASLADDSEITIDIDTAGANATGAKITIIGTRP